MAWETDNGTVFLRFADETVEVKKDVDTIKEALRLYGVNRARLIYDGRVIEPADLDSVPDGATLTVEKISVGA